MPEKSKRDLKDELTALFHQVDEGIDLDDTGRMKLLSYFAGVVEGLHTQLDYVRDIIDEHDPRNPIDHNVEQAQVSLEVAGMRIGQLLLIVGQRLEDQEQEQDTTPVAPGPAWDEGRGDEEES